MTGQGKAPNTRKRGPGKAKRSTAGQVTSLNPFCTPALQTNPQPWWGFNAVNENELHGPQEDSN